MLRLADRSILVLLLIVHGGLLLWALTGMAEWLLPAVPWPALSNPLFSPAMLLAQWVAIGAAALAFLLGHALRWRRMREAIVVCYAVMAAICAVQTFTILQNDFRYVGMVLEYIVYVTIVAYLYRSPLVRRRLVPDLAGGSGRTAGAAAGQSTTG